MGITFLDKDKTYKNGIIECFYERDF